MSNPHVSISDFESTGSASNDNISWAMNVFGRENFYLYKKDETPESIDPTQYSSPFNMIYTVGNMDTQENSPPDFISDVTWKENYANAPSIFLTANNSVMPKMIGPNVVLVSNGIKINGGQNQAVLNALFNSKYNWNYDVDDDSSFSNYECNTSVDDTKLWINIVANGWETTKTFKLNKDSVDASSEDASSVNIDGAFSIILNVVPLLTDADGSDGEGNVDKNTKPSKDPGWRFKLDFGDVHAEMTDVAAMNVKIDGGSEHSTPVNLASARAAEGAPQCEAMYGTPFLLTFFKCWNGVIVSTGRQDSSQVRHTASNVCKKYRDTSLIDLFTKLFKRDAPDDVEIPSSDDGKDYDIDFGDELTVSVTNCKVQLAYIPNFFLKAGTFDNFQLLNYSTDDTTYTNELFYLFSKNNSKFSVDISDGKALKKALYDETGLEWRYWQYKFRSNDDTYQREAAEIFGYVIKNTETQKTVLKNSNGTFSFQVTGEDAQGSGYDWKDFITSVSVTTGMDGSSGKIDVDVLGYAGNNLTVTQSIGGIAIEASGGNHTTSGTIFKGIAMGIANNTSSSGHSVSINLVGIEKKLQDMVLIIPPFMDGWTLSKACRYLFGYAGVSFAMHGDGSIKLASSTSISAAVFDWKTGTTVETALNDVMLNTHHDYCIIDGKAEVYELGDDSLPTMLGNSHDNYSGVNIASYDLTPNFEDLRNYITAMGVACNSAGAGTQLESLPIRTLVVTEENDTTPEIGWAKVWAQARPGYTVAEGTGDGDGYNDEDSLETFVENMKKQSRKFELSGSVTVAGNAGIKPWDTFGDYVVSSVTHDIDTQSKTWTTSLELYKGGENLIDSPSAGGW